MAAVSELISLEERVSDSTYAKALNYLIHFATPGECINYLFAVGVKTKPDKTIVSDSKTINGVNCVRKRMNLLGDGYQSFEYTPVEQSHEEVLVNWMWETDFKVSNWHKFLSQKSDLYKGGLTDGEGSSEKKQQPTSSETSSTLPRRIPSYWTKKQTSDSATTSSATIKTGPSFMSGGFQDAALVGFQPGINYSSEERRNEAPLTLEECQEVNEELIKRLLDPNRKISSHDDDIVAAVASLKPDDLNKTEVILMAERKLQRERHSQFMLKLKAGTAEPDNLILPPLDASDLLGATVEDEMDSRFQETLGERYKKTLEEYIAFKTCAHRLVRACYHKDNSDKPGYITYLNHMKTSILNHFVRLGASRAFNVKAQTSGMLEITKDIENCVAKLKEAKLFPDDIDADISDRNVKEYMIEFSYPDGSVSSEKVTLPKGWDDPLLPEESPEVEIFRKHHMLRHTGTFDGTEPHTLNFWWGIFKDKVHRVPGVANCDKWEHIVVSKLLEGAALTTFLGGSKKTVSTIANKDHEYVYGMQRLFIKYDRADNKWDNLLQKLDKIQINQEDADETNENIYELQQLLRDMKSAKPKGKTNDDVARIVHGKRREIFSNVLLDSIDSYIASSKIQQEFLKGHYDYVVQGYLVKIQKNIGSRSYSKTYSIKTQNSQRMDELFKMLDESKRKAKGSSSGENPAKKGKFIGAAIAKSASKASPPVADSKKPNKPTIKSTDKPKDKYVSAKKPVSNKASVPGNYNKIGTSLKPKAKVTFESKSPTTTPPPEAAAAYTEIQDMFDQNVHVLMEEEEGSEQEEEVMELDEEEKETKAGGDELKSEIDVLKGQINALIQVATVQHSRPPYAPEPMSTPQSTSHVNATQPDVNIQQTVDLAKIMKNINIIKEKLCFFTHRSTEPVQHKLWDCALSQNVKSEELGERKQCRFCWQMGHVSKNCTVRVPMHCDFCDKPGHWKPFCGQFINKAYQNYNLKLKQKQQESAAAASNSAEETPEQYAARVSNEAVHNSRIAEASTALLSHFSLTGGAPLGHAPQLLLNK
jgi:hypothetical protein